MLSIEGFAPQFRLLTSSFRSLPHFIIIGTQKGGTSSLFHYLAQHPQIFASSAKEVHFFDGGLDPKADTHAKGLHWYRSHFPLKRSMGKGDLTGEASPLYIFNPLVPARIHGVLPNVKLIALLRDPAERAISHYFHERRKKRETLPIMKALQAEESRISASIGNANLKSKKYIHYSYKSRGLYKEQLERYLQYFRREQLLILSSEEFFEQPQKTLHQVFGFLGVDEGFEVKDTKPVNVGKNRTDVPAEVYEYLRAYYAPHNEALYELIGRDFGWA
jgi:hypothetical protein